MSKGCFHPGIAAQIRNADALKQELAEISGNAGTLLVHSQRRWGSTSFNGVRHELTYAFDGQQAVQQGELLIALLPDHDFTIPGQLVADATVEVTEHRQDPPRLTVTMQLLLVDE